LFGFGTLNRWIARERGDGSSFQPWQTWSESAAAAPPVTLEEARSLPGVGRGVSFSAAVLSQLNPHAYVDDRRLVPTPRLLVDPAPGWHPLPAWLTGVAEDLLWHGNAFARVGFDAAQHRVSLDLLDASRMTWDAGYLYRGSDGTETRLAGYEVWHAAVNVRPGRIMGSGILADYQHALKLIRATESAQLVAMRSGVPLGIITIDGSPTAQQMQTYKTKFLESQQERSVAMMTNAKWQTVNWSPAELGMIPAREFNLRLASDITGVPPYLLGVPAESRVYSNQETEWTNFLRGNFGRIVSTVEAGLTRLRPDWHVRFDIDELLRPDSSARWANHQIATTIGAMTIDEVREVERLGPTPAALKQPKPAPTPEPEPADDDAEDETP
jgi:HK97 family phage portal protein